MPKQTLEQPDNCLLQRSLHYFEPRATWTSGDLLQNHKGSNVGHLAKDDEAEF